jgi:hypothetical protein
VELRIGREDVLELNAVTRVGEHVGNRIAPFREVRGGAVMIEIGYVPVDLVKDDARWVILLLQDVEADAARFLYTAARIFFGGLKEGVEELRLDVDEDLEDEHVVTPIISVSLQSARGLKSATSERYALSLF